MTNDEENGFIALTIHVCQESDTISTGMVDNLGVEIDMESRELLYKVVAGLSSLLSTDMARIGALGELVQNSSIIESMRESILSSKEEEENTMQAEIVFEADPELEEAIRRAELH